MAIKPKLETLMASTKEAQENLEEEVQSCHKCPNKEKGNVYCKAHLVYAVSLIIIAQTIFI